MNDVLCFHKIFKSMRPRAEGRTRSMTSITTSVDCKEKKNMLMQISVFYQETVRFG